MNDRTKLAEEDIAALEKLNDMMGFGRTYEAVSRIIAALRAPEVEESEYPAAYQQFKDGRWVECPTFIARGFDDTISEGCRALYLHPPAQETAEAETATAAGIAAATSSDAVRVLWELYRWYDRDGSVGGAANVFEDNRNAFLAALTPSSEGATVQSRDNLTTTTNQEN